MEKSLRPYTVNLINSVIGVSILAMPFCFYKCGYLLGVLVLAFVAFITYLSSCQLLHLAYFHKKTTYEFLALHVFGSLGKLVVELCMIGMIMGTFVAFFVIIGDLGPEIAKDVFRIETSPRMRAVFLTCLAMFFVLPLSMQRSIESLSNVSAVSLLFYSIFLLHIIWMAIQRLFSGEKGPPMIQWNVSGIFKCMPIMSMAFGLQPQLFIVYEALGQPNMAVMQNVVKTTLSFVSAVYVGVGFSGYFAFSNHEVLPGDILTLYSNTLSINILKIGFALTVAISFPLLIFPLRASLYSLIFLQKKSGADLTEEATFYMPDLHFKIITFFVILFTLICGIIVPNVEFVLALTGSVTGSVMFFILPALMYIKTFGTYSPLFTSKAGIPFSSSASSSTSSSVSSPSSHRRLRIHPLIVLVTGVCVLLVGSMIAVEDQQAQGGKAPSIHKTRSTPKPDVTFGDNLKERVETMKHRQELLRRMKANSNNEAEEINGHQRSHGTFDVVLRKFLSSRLTNKTLPQVIKDDAAQQTFSKEVSKQKSSPTHPTTESPKNTTERLPRQQRAPS